MKQDEVQKLLDEMCETSGHVPTVYDCNGCKYNTGLLKCPHCSDCRVIDVDWRRRGRPTKYEQVVLTFTTTGSTDDYHSNQEETEL